MVAGFIARARLASAMREPLAIMLLTSNGITRTRLLIRDSVVTKVVDANARLNHARFDDCVLKFRRRRELNHCPTLSV